MSLSVYEIRFGAIQDNNRENHNLLRYKDELKHLKADIGKSMDDDDSILRWIYRRVSQELSFITGSTVRVA